MPAIWLAVCIATASGHLLIDLHPEAVAKGRTFDGVGGLSGGDGDSTEGSESSHEHVQGEISCNRGYEWFVMKEAKMRNPEIRLYGLSWSFPNYLAGATGNPLDNPNTPTYIADWIACAKNAHNLTIDFIGVWNEMDKQFASSGAAYIKSLRKVLDGRGFQSTRIVAGDVHSWAPATAMLTDPDLAKTVDVVCRHYPSTLSDLDAKKTGKPLWSSEDYATANFGSGARCEARILNHNWVMGEMTATINWNLISSYYDFTSWPDDGFSITARSPWSGYYEIQPPLWAAAHTTQFASVGDILLVNQSGSGLLPGGGSYVTYFNDATGSISIVIEKVQPQLAGCGFSTVYHYATTAEDVTFTFQGPNAMSLTNTLRVWRSNFGENGTFFLQEAPISVDTKGEFTVHVNVDDVLTLTTTSGQAKGTFTPVPPESRFPTEYSDDFDGYLADAAANYFTEMSGAFDIHISNLSTHNATLRQNAVGPPVKWLRDDILPFAVLGDSDWIESEVQVCSRDPGGCIVSATCIHCVILYSVGGLSDRN
eukprot:m.307892 g.307892  ORF g.307892 m.307892 type:complete len:537 (-) comp16369_c0_seq6:6215-7825(-)